MIFISTGGRRNQTAATTALEYYRHDLYDVELSGGAYSPTCESDLKALPKDLRLQVHNYFPPPASPFVFNLASSDTHTAALSLAQVRTGMQTAVLVGRPIYSFHAGFRIDPKVSELGERLICREMTDRAQALDIFTERVFLLAEEARRAGVTLLVENNVLNEVNLATYGQDPLLLTQPDEIASFMVKAPSNVGLLLDVAHLKVSARALGFDLVNAHERLKPWIRGYHLSDNDGSADTNEPVTEKSWFWDDLVRGLDYYSLEVYRIPICDLVAQKSMVMTKLFAEQPKSTLELKH